MLHDGVLKSPPDPLEIARLDRSEIEAIQSEKLSRMLKEILPANRFYASKFEEAGIEPGEIRTVEDLRRLPFTTRAEIFEDQRDNPPYGSNMTYEITRYVRLHQSSGTTTGRPLRWLDTQKNWDWFYHLWDVIYRAAGFTREDRYYFPFSFGPFIGFWAAFESAQRMGSLTLPGGALSSEARLRMLLEHEATIVCTTPTYSLRLAEVAAEKGFDLPGSKVRALIIAGEPGGSIPEVRHAIEAAWGARCLDHWGMTECGPVGFEHVDEPNQMYLTETECIAEVIDPKSGEPLDGDGEGELTITSLGRYGSPVLRYRTGDLVRMRRGPGRLLNFASLEGGVIGRCDDMVFIRGNNVYPAAIDAIVRRFPEVREYQAEVVRGPDTTELHLRIEPAPAAKESAAGLVEKVSQAIYNTFLFHAQVSSVEPGTLPRFELKAKRFHIRNGGGDD